MPSIEPLELAALLCVWLSVSAWQRNFQGAGRRLFISVALACIAWCAADICFRSGLLTPMNARRIALPSWAITAPLWFSLAAHAADLRIVRRAPWLPLALAVPPLSGCALLFSDSLAPLYLSLAPGGSTIPGPLLSVALFYALVLEGLGAALFVTAAVQMSAPDQWLRRIGVAIAGVIPLAVETFYAMNSEFFSFDPGPIGLSAALLILYGAIFSGGLFHALPSAQLDLVQHLPVPMLIANRKGVVIDSNPAAIALLGLSARRTLWRDVDEVLSEIDDSIESERWPILSQGHEAAQLVLLDSPLKPYGADRGNESITSGANVEEVPDR